MHSNTVTLYIALVAGNDRGNSRTDVDRYFATTDTKAMQYDMGQTLTLNTNSYPLSTTPS